jgi:hypothetical protein
MSRPICGPGSGPGGREQPAGPVWFGRRLYRTCCTQGEYEHVADDFSQGWPIACLYLIKLVRVADCWPCGCWREIAETRVFWATLCPAAERQYRVAVLPLTCGSAAAHM